MTLAEALRVPPKQDRAGQRVNQIVEAARAHYEAVGRDNFRVPPIARAIGCSNATVFRYFSKNQLLHLVEEQNEDTRDQKIREILESNLKARSADKTDAMQEVLALLAS